jgi:hypothetical protein
MPPTDTIKAGCNQQDCTLALNPVYLAAIGWTNCTQRGAVIASGYHKKKFQICFLDSSIDQVWPHPAKLTKLVWFQYRRVMPGHEVEILEPTI